ncbi:MAG: UvrD-helicase domain-containing protein [Candidatus Yonathbacteria bacterium]|nr:UvrD-helicase domain-containing protein [Candidatus Yonathbacteria bacterium]
MVMPHLKHLNDKQREAALHKDGPLLIIAGAGTGKTSTLTHRILNLVKEGVAPNEILAITFTNKAAKEMLERVDVLLAKHGFDIGMRYGDTRPFIGTFHSLGVYILRAHANIFGLTKHFAILDKNSAGSLMKEAVKEQGLDSKQFSPDRIAHVISRQKGNLVTLDEYKKDVGNAYFPMIVAAVWERYERFLAREKALDFDDLILKTVILLRTHPEIRAEYQKRWKYVHIDEYQDTNGVQYELARLLAGEGKNICVVGDGDQCIVSGTKIAMEDGALKPIEKIQRGDMVYSNHGSGDCRGSRVTDVFKKKYSGNLVRISLEKGQEVVSTPEHIHFAGYLLGVAPQYHFTYLMWKQNVGFRIGVSQVYTKGQKKPVVGFAQRVNQERADKLWIISAHKNSNEARILEYELSLKYRIPTLPFVARKGASTGGYVHDQKVLEMIFSKFDTEKTGKELLLAYGLSENHPHHLSQSRNSSRRNITVTLCGDHRGKTTMHRIAMVGNDEQGREMLSSLGFSVRPAKKTSLSWRFETARANYEELVAITSIIQKAFGNINVILNARLGKQSGKTMERNSLPFLPAASVLPGMSMFDKSGNYITVQKVEYINVRNTTVYDLNIEHTHNFIANGIATHNSIYSWRGANLQNILNFEQDYAGSKTIFLEENYRSTQTILAVANDIIKKNTVRKGKKLYTKNIEGDKISLIENYNEGGEARAVGERIKALIYSGTDPEDIAVLYRANFQSRALEEAFLLMGIPYQVLGTRFFERKEVKDILSFIRAALNPESLSDIKRIIDVPPRGIGKATLVKMFAKDEGALSPAAQKRAQEFWEILAQIRECSLVEKTSKLIKFVSEKTGLEASLKTGTDEDNDRLENIHELVTLATKYDILPPEEAVEKLLGDAALASDQDSLMKNERAVKMMTVHAAKGLEFLYVFVTGLEQDLFPHRRMSGGVVSKEDSEEERRLFYVAITRAKKKLFLSYASVRTIFGQRQVNAPSEFLLDIDDRYLDREAGDSGHEPVISISW